VTAYMANKVYIMLI